MNTKKYYIYSFFGSLFPIYPLYLLMMENEGFTVAQISMLLAIWSIPCVLLEIPSGILADRWSRKNMLVLGAFLKALCYFTWFISKNYFSIAIGFIFWGIGSGFRSGSEEALLYDSLLKEKKEEQFDRIYGKGNFLSGVSNVLAAVTGGIIGMRYGYNTALILSVASGFISTTIALSFKEVNIYREQQNEDKNFIGTLGGAVFFLIKDKKLFMFAIMTLLVITTAGVMDEYDQLIAKDFGLTIELIGIWSAVRFILIALGSYIAGNLRLLIEKIIRRKDNFYIVGVISLAAASCLLLAGWLGFKYAIIIYGMYYLLLSAGEVISEDYIQKKIENEGRSTVHSIISLSQNLYAIACYGLFGLGASRANLMQLLIFCSAYIAVCTLATGGIYALIKKRRHLPVSKLIKLSADAKRQTAFAA